MSKKTKKDDVIHQQEAEVEINSEQDELITEIVDSLNQLDEHLPTPGAPNLLFMQQLVTDRKQMLRERNRRDLFIFVSMALVIVSVYAVVAAVSWQWLLLCQFVLFVVIGGWAFIGYRQAQKKVKSPHA